MWSYQTIIIHYLIVHINFKNRKTGRDALWWSRVPILSQIHMTKKGCESVNHKRLCMQIIFAKVRFREWWLTGAWVGGRGTSRAESDATQLPAAPPAPSRPRGLDLTGASLLELYDAAPFCVSTERCTTWPVSRKTYPSAPRCQLVPLLFKLVFTS